VNEPRLSAHRYERKFFLETAAIAEVELLVKLHPAGFREIYHQRRVNNIYFDTFSLRNYYENIAGAAQRQKVRIRWYNELFGRFRDPMLEVKLRAGAVGRKLSLALPELLVDPGIRLPDFAFLAEERFPGGLADFTNLRPVLLNSYIRRYYLSADTKFRLTLDWQQEFLEVRSGRVSTTTVRRDHHSVIVELKYGPEDDDEALKVISRFPFRLTRSSKYVRGLQLLYGLPQ
jgi:hypothetical protein